MRRFFLLLAISFFMAFPAHAASPIFQDVPESHVNFHAIRSLKELGIIEGFPDLTFRPSEQISRAEALALILKATKSYRQARAAIPTASTEEILSDVPGDAWFRPFVEEGLSLKIVSGYEDKTFRPLNPIKLSEALKLGISAFGFGISETKEGSWYARYFHFAEEKNLMDPDEEGSPSPHKLLRRAEMAELIFRLKFVKEENKAFERIVAWNTLSHDANYFEIKYPPGWQVFKGSKNSAVFRPDPKHGHVWLGRITPFSGRVTISFVENIPPSPKAWFSEIKEKQLSLYAPRRAKKPSAYVRFEEIMLNGRPALLTDVPRKRFFDGYMALGNSRGLIFYGEYGKSALSDFLRKQIETMIRSYRYIEPKPPSPPPLTPEQKLEKIRELILIEGKGPDSLKLIPDKKLIETDAIGVGTGPVDYFYSKEINATLKYERSSKTLLDLREGETTKF